MYGIHGNGRPRAPLGLGWWVGLTLVCTACAVPPESHTSHDGIEDQLDALASQVDALASQVDALQSQVSSLTEQLEALEPEEPSGLEWEVFTYTCGVEDNGPVSLGRSAEGIAVTHTFRRLASEPEDTWNAAALAIDILEGDLTIYCSVASSADDVSVFLVALGWER